MLGFFGCRSGIVRDRRLVIDLCRIAGSLPLYPLERTMHLGELAAIRQAASPQISWPVLFMKAYGLVAAQEPRLRQSYIRWPWPHLLHHRESVAMLAVNRRHGDAERLCWGRFIEPEHRSLVDLQAELERYKTEPVEEIFRRQVRLSFFPAILRRLAWWLALNTSGSKRGKRVGTFGMSTVAGQGGLNHYHPSCLTTSITYGPLDAAGRMAVTLVFDHRVIDGAPLAAALARLEEVLNGPIARELADHQRHSRAA